MKMDSSDDDKKLSIKTIDEGKSSSVATGRQRDDNDRLSSDSDSDSDLSDSEYVCSVCSKKFSGFIPYTQHEKSGKHAKALQKKRRKRQLLEKIASAEKFSGNDDEYLFFIKKPYAVCKTCNKQFEGPESYQMHLVSRAHKQKVLQASILDQVRDNGEINVDMLKELYKNKEHGDGGTEDFAEETREKIDSLKLKDGDNSDGSEELECKDCEKCFSGLIPYTQHILSKIHAKTVKKKKLLGKITKSGAQYSSESGQWDISSLVVEDDILVCKLCTMTFSGPESAMMHLKSHGHSKNLEKFSRKKQRKQMASTSRTKPRSDSASDSSGSETLTTERVIGEQKDNQKPSSETKPEKESSSSSDFDDPTKHSSEAKVPLSSDKYSNSDSRSHAETKFESDGMSHEARKADSIEPSAPPAVENSDVKQNENVSPKSETRLNYENYKMYKKVMQSLKESDKDT